MIRAVLAAVLYANLAHSADVTITVSNVPNAKGWILGSLCSNTDFLSTHCRFQARIPSAPGNVSLHFTGVIPGTYAAEVFQDSNGNGLLDRNFIGIPREPIGFSNDTALRFGPPRFEAAAFDVHSSVTHITVHLRIK